MCAGVEYSVCARVVCMCVGVLCVCIRVGMLCVCACACCMCVCDNYTANVYAQVYVFDCVTTYKENVVFDSLQRGRLSTDSSTYREGPQSAPLPPV